MCVNYTLPLFEDFRAHFDTDPPATWEEYKAEAYPGYSAPIILRSPEHEDDRISTRARFGLIPFFAKDETIGRRCYNSRSETAATKPSFRGPWKRRQFCIVPARAFFEPNYESGRAVRWKIERSDDQPFGIAALWDTWRKSENEIVRSFSLLTVNAEEHSLMRRFHGPQDEKRSIVVLAPEHYDDWLDADDQRARSLMQLFDADTFHAEAAPPQGRQARSTERPPEQQADPGLF